MFSGDVNRRKTSGFGKNIQSCFRCYTGVNFGGNTNSPCMDPQRDTETFPKTPCPGGIRSSVLFPMWVFFFPVMDKVVERTEISVLICPLAAGTARIWTAPTTWITSPTPLTTRPHLPW